MFVTGNKNRNKYTFKKIQGSHKYKQYTKNMSFALKKARLWRHVKRMAIPPPPLKVKKDDSEDWMEKIYAQQEKIVKFKNNARKAITKIGKMCTDTVQKEFFSVKTLSK